MLDCRLEHAAVVASPSMTVPGEAQYSEGVGCKARQLRLQAAEQEAELWLDQQHVFRTSMRRAGQKLRFRRGMQKHARLLTDSFLDSVRLAALGEEADEFPQFQSEAAYLLLLDANWQVGAMGLVTIFFEHALQLCCGGVVLSWAASSPDRVSCCL